MSIIFVEAKITAKWKSLVRKFHSERRKEEKVTSGAGADQVFKSSFEHYQRLQFLKDSADAGESTGNLDGK